jgi:hypothetical protein
MVNRAGLALLQARVVWHDLFHLPHVPDVNDGRVHPHIGAVCAQYVKVTAMDEFYFFVLVLLEKKQLSTVDHRDRNRYRNWDRDRNR